VKSSNQIKPLSKSAVKETLNNQNMKTILRITTIAMLGALLGIAGCKKASEVADELDAGVELQQLASDENSAQSESDGVLTDLNTVMENSPYNKIYPLSNATVDDSTFAGQKIITITYNGDNADGSRNRTGKVILQLINGAKWTDAGATIKIVYNQVVITRKANNKSCEFNGVFYLENVSGGKAFVASPVVHKYWGEGLMTFDKDGSSRSWNINRKRTFTNESGVLSIKTEGDTTINSVSNVLVWGKNRHSNSFYTQISTPIVISSACTNGPISGVKIHKGMAKDVTVTFGVDENGTPVTSGCAYGFKAEWTNKKNESKSVVKAY